MKKGIAQSIIPALLAYSRQELEQKIEIIRKTDPKPQAIQIDVMDGVFVKNTTFPTPKDLKKAKIGIPLEIHLMTKNPGKRIKSWKNTGAQRIFFHYEAVRNPRTTIKTIQKYKIQAGIAINPETSVLKIQNLLPYLDAVLVMSVKPGKGGQAFQTKALKKIEALRKIAPHTFIAVDGGVNYQNAPRIFKAGANELAMGTAYFKKHE